MTTQNIDFLDLLQAYTQFIFSYSTVIDSNTILLTRDTFGELLLYFHIVSTTLKKQQNKINVKCVFIYYKPKNISVHMGLTDSEHSLDNIDYCT